MSSTSVKITGACHYCGGFHLTMCPRIKSIEYHGDGTVKKVELHEPWMPAARPSAAAPGEDAVR